VIFEGFLSLLSDNVTYLVGKCLLVFHYVNRSIMLQPVLGVTSYIYRLSIILTPGGGKLDIFQTFYSEPSRNNSEPSRNIVIRCQDFCSN